MSEPVKVIAISDTERVRVDYDEYAPSPLEWDWDAGIHTLTQNRDYRPFTLDYQDQQSQLETIRAERDYAGLDYPSNDDLVDALETHLRRAGMSVKTLTLHGSSQSEWWDVIIYGATEEAVKSLLKTLRMYLDGNVYVVRHERLVKYADVTDNTNTHTHWELFDCVGDVYLDYDASNDEILDALGMTVTTN